MVRGDKLVLIHNQDKTTVMLNGVELKSVQSYELKGNHTSNELTLKLLVEVCEEKEFLTMASDAD